jgi:hypothetical protein
MCRRAGSRELCGRDGEGTVILKLREGRKGLRIG